MFADGRPGEPPVIVDEIYTWLAFETASASPASSFVIVEGGLDRRVYRKILDDRNRCIILAHPEIGRELIRSAFPLNDDYRSRTLGIIDRDFDYALPGRSYEEGLIVTPTHDVETLVLSTPAFDNLLEEIIDPDTRAAFEKTNGVPTIMAILRAARLIGLLRLYNAQIFDPERRGLNFKAEGTGRIPYEDYVGTRNFSLSFDGLIDWLFYNTDHPFFKRETEASALKASILAGVAALDETYSDDWLVCQGHDLVALIALGLKEHFGNRAEDMKMIIEELGSRMTSRSVLKPEYLHGCPIGDRIHEWEEAHPPFRVLRDAARASSTSSSHV